MQHIKSKRKPVTFIKRAFCGAIFLALFNAFPYFLQSTETPVVLSDGPYISWQGQQATVIYVVDGKVTTRQIDAAGKQEIFVHLREMNQTLALTVEEPKVEPDTYKRVKKIFAVSDIHGQFKHFIRLLKAHKVIDENRRWQWRKGHLVIVGDVFDRGPQVTECLWLIHQLEQQAKKSGGRVHMLLGNHEVMVLQGDLRYLHKKYRKISTDILKQDMTKLYGKTTELGRWLRTRHTFLKINKNLFIHGGIHPLILEKHYTPTSLNTFVRSTLDTPKEIIHSDTELSFIYGSRGPFWYRGFFEDGKTYTHLDVNYVDYIQRYFEVKRIIVGHTTQEHVHLLYGKRIAVVDSGFKYGDRGEGLLIKRGRAYKATLDGKLIRLKKSKEKK
jgi:hypothetical protein